ncbi:MULTISPECIES: DNA-processing protein DprA [Comamonas]|uniref:DNA-processing protein DprA n=1 Tax=Comamonas TaxID=283 RepID=UPI00257ECCBC|nr:MULTISPECIES: DNA-processing protein DprA [Comamonas]
MRAAIAPWERAELQAWLRLSLTPSIGNAAARRLLAHFGSASAIFEACATELLACVSGAQAAQLRHPPEGFEQAFETTWQWLNAGTQEVAHALVTLGDPRYPEGLLHTPDPPLMLYVLGAPRWLNQACALLDWQRSLAIVGSRNPTPQGADNAFEFARHLACQGWTVVSGMALGIDAAAHEGGLAAGSSVLPTVAVIGTGVDRVYPRAHKQLAHRLAQQGLVISEFPLGTPPIASNFPKRNRIISGLTRGTLVVEAALASGSLITARTASEQGREVFAIPGSIHSPQARGCHALIRQGAKLVESAQDILEEFSDYTPDAQSAGGESTAGLAEHPLLQAMGYDPVHVEILSDRTGWSAADVQAQLLELELEGHVGRLPGGLYQRTGQA